MAIDRLPSGAFRTRLTVDGVRYVETFATRPQAQDWETVTRAKAVTGSLPTHVTVEEYAARWLRTYDARPVNTRIFHTRNLRVVTATLGSSQLAKVVSTDITVMLNRVIETKGAAYAARVYRPAATAPVVQHLLETSEEHGLRLVVRRRPDGAAMHTVDVVRAGPSYGPIGDHIAP